MSRPRYGKPCPSCKKRRRSQVLRRDGFIIIDESVCMCAVLEMWKAKRATPPKATP